MPFTLPRFSASDESEDLLGEGNDDAACHRQHTVGALGGIVALEGQAHLQDAEAQQDEANGADQRENEIRQVVDHRQRVIYRQRRHRGGDQKQGNAGKDGIDPLCLSLEIFVVQIMFHAAAFSFSLSKSVWNSGFPGIGGSAVPWWM